LEYLRIICGDSWMSHQHVCGILTIAREMAAAAKSPVMDPRA